jgi:signal transduction histidine kinase
VIDNLASKFANKRAWTKFAGSVVRSLVTVVAICIVVASQGVAAQETRVLFLNATDPYLPAYVMIDTAMRDALAKNTTRRFQYFSETLDAQRIAFGGFEQEFLALLAKKYKGLQIDIIVTMTQPALDFVSKYRNELWPNGHVLFHRIPTRALQGVVLPERTTGITSPRAIGRTVDLAYRLQPNARRILVIAGDSDFDKDIAEEAREVLAARSEPAETQYLLGLSQPELVERLAREPASTIVLYLSQFRDREGRPYTPGELMRAVSAVSPAPIYGLYETYLGDGIAGGVVESYKEAGRMLAERLVQLGSGASVPALSEVPNQCAVDVQALRKWSLEEKSLPEGCEIRFAELSLWRTYPLQISGILAVVLLQGALITWLLFVRRGRTRATELAGKARVETGQYRESLAHLVRVHTVGEMSTAIAHEINQPLVAIKNYALAARRRLAGGAAVDAAKVDELLDKIGGQASRAGDVLHSLRAMVKKHESEATRIQVGQLVADTLKLVEMESRKADIRVECTTAPGLPPVFVDGIQIQQVVLNLMRNAIEAVEEAGITSSIIKVGVVSTPENEVAVTVADQGPGIVPADAEHIFDPFYSTKGGGLGVGLSISRAIVEAHGGRLSLTPNSGGGCVFKFTLPAASTGR